MFSMDCNRKHFLTNDLESIVQSGGLFILYIDLVLCCLLMRDAFNC